MIVDCQWVEKNLEALCSDHLTDEDSRLARVHIETCVSCGKEMQAMRVIDPFIKNYFHRQLEIARRPRAVHRARVFGLSGAVLTGVTVLVLLLVRTPQTSPVIAPVVVQEETASVDPAPVPPPKVDEPGDIIRAKPAAEPSAPVDRRQPASSRVTANSPDFLVTDPAGYAHTLDEYRGRVVVMGVWSRNQTGSIVSIERLYKANADNPKLRFLGVSNEHQARPANTTFPIVYNQGSKLLGAKPGEFVLLDETGAVELRGSLVTDFDRLQTVLEGK